MGLTASLAWWGGVKPGHWSCGYLLNHAVDGGLLVYVVALLVPDRVGDLLLRDGVDGDWCSARSSPLSGCPSPRLWWLRS